jgi:hypothetical protein
VNTRDLPFERELAKANTAEAELAIIAARATADVTSVVL